jgi:hypothetical protein
VIYVEGREHYVHKLLVGLLPGGEVECRVGLLFDSYLAEEFCQVQLPLLEEQFQPRQQLQLSTYLLLLLDLGVRKG